MMMIPLIILIVILFYRFDEGKSSSSYSAMDLLNRKLVDGEISEEEYQIRKSLILNK